MVLSMVTGGSNNRLTFIDKLYNARVICYSRFDRHLKTNSKLMFINFTC
jgi:hypothetical protein